MAAKDSAPAAPASNFIRHIVEADLAAGKYRLAPLVGPAWRSRPARGRPRSTRRASARAFRRSPTGYLHIGHAKSICLNFGLAREFGGACHLRFDDTNPAREEQQYVDSIIDVVRWLGFDWGPNLYFASNYFDAMYRCAVALIERGHAYVDSQSGRSRCAPVAAR